MKKILSDKKIFIAFLLNLFFTIIEFIGGLLTNSAAIVADAVHDLSDAVSIGLAYLFERKSRRRPDKQYTYGYSRYSLLGAVITLSVLLLSSIATLAYGLSRLLSPVKIDYSGMIVLAMVGLIVNLIAARVTHGGKSLNQRAVNLHMLEDVLGWAIVLIGAVVMKFTDWNVIDPLMSIAVAVFILVNVIKKSQPILSTFLEKVPQGIDIVQISKIISEVPAVEQVHDVHVSTIDGQYHQATLHVIVDDLNAASEVKTKIRESLKQFNILHVTVETETLDEKCQHRKRRLKPNGTHH